MGIYGKNLIISGSVYFYATPRIEIITTVFINPINAIHLYHP